MITSRTWLVLALATAIAGAAGAGEIIVAPQSGNAGSSRSAGDQRDRARAYQKDSAAGSTTIVVVPEEESPGILAPRFSAPENRASDNRNRARQMQSGKEGGEVEVVVPGNGEAATTRDRARDLRSRAAAYTRGDSHTNSNSKDGLPVIACKDVESVAGRIGDDASSGSVIVIIRDGKPMKVRCQ